jgi:hypothetical protein
MARGVSNQAKDTATTATNLATAQANLNQQQQQQNTDFFNSIAQNYRDIIAAPGYTPEQQSAITNSEMGSLGATYDALGNQAKLNATRTRNDAAYTSLLDDLARSKGEQAADLAAKTEAGFAQNAQQQREMALGGLSKLYGVNTDLLSRQLGLPPEYLNASTGALNTANNAGSSFGFGLGPFSFGTKF